MTRRPRSELPDEGIFHVGARGAGRIPIFLEDDDRHFFLLLLGIAVMKYEWRCYAFCLMGNHYHLVVETRREQLSDGMQLLNGDHAQTFNLKYGRWGHLFGGRFWSRYIPDDDRLVETITYVLENPVRAGLCDHWTDWPWSALEPGFGEHEQEEHDADHAVHGEEGRI
jgi:REP element-mobilizing transposase RayT